jgi:fructose 1,6-bisphosphatase
LDYELKNGYFPIIDIFKRKKVSREPAGDLLNLFQMIGKYSRQAHKVWMSDEKPEEILSNEFMSQKISYIHFNSVKAGYVREPQEYLFSSATNYYLDDDSLFKITKIMPV